MGLKHINPNKVVNFYLYYEGEVEDAKEYIINHLKEHKEEVCPTSTCTVFFKSYKSSVVIYNIYKDDEGNFLLDGGKNLSSNF